MKTLTRITLLVVALTATAAVGWVAIAADRPAVELEPERDAVRIAALVEDMEAVGSQQLEQMPALEIERWRLPEPGVDVMRARLEETYRIDGVGEDTVELTGWIAVRHGAARPAAGFTEVRWDTAVLDTEFVGLELSGTSELFGRVRVTLDEGSPVRGEVGRIEIPDRAREMLLARLGDEGQERKEPRKREPARSTAAASATGGWEVLDGRRVLKGPIGDVPEMKIRYIDSVEGLDRVDEAVISAGACKAALGVNVSLLDLGLELTTERPVHWYSLIDTIPPVGHRASVAIEPVPLVADGRRAGTLVSGEVKFRQVVRHLPLGGTTAVEADRLAGSAF